MKRGISLRYIQKTKGGRLQNTATFCTECDIQSRDGVWHISKLLQSTDEASDDFAAIGISKLTTSNTHVVVKVMLRGRSSKQEILVQKYFQSNVHQNIVQGLCHFECYQNAFTWFKKRAIDLPIPICNANGSERIIVCVQEYISNGDLNTIKQTIDIDLWWSITRQLTYAVLELFDNHGFLYGDWHFGNILLDEQEIGSITYRAFGKKWVVPETHGIRPVLTDFSRSELRPAKTLEPWQLTTQLGLVWDMMLHICPEINVRRQFEQYAFEIDECETIDDIIVFLRKHLTAS